MFGAVALVLAAVAAIDPVPATPADAARPLIIRVYQQDEYRRDLIPELQQAVSRIVDGTGVAVWLIDCRPARACEGRGILDLVMVVTRGQHASPGVCGEAVVGEGRRPGRLMIVYAGCVRAVAGELRAAAALGRAAATLQFLTEWDVLGPVVIHELVHLLLPELSHGHGLMRAALGQADWAAAGPRLDAHTVRSLAAAIGARNAAARVAGR